MARCPEQAIVEIPAALQHIGLHPCEQRLLALLRHLKFGTITRLVIRDGLPVLAEDVTKTIKFD